MAIERIVDESLDKVNPLSWRIDEPLLRCDTEDGSCRTGKYYQETLSLLPDKYRDSAKELLNEYPDMPYHNLKHGLDVMRAVDVLVPLVEIEELHDEDNLAALLMAAVAHDAGVGSENARAYDTDEYYSIELFKNIAGPLMSERQVSLASEAILGTIFNPVYKSRNSKIAKLLHHADLGYVWLSESDEFMDYIVNYYVEACSHLSWSEFKKFEDNFLKAHILNVKNDMAECGMDSVLIDRISNRIDENRKFLAKCDSSVVDKANKTPSCAISEEDLWQ